GTALRCRSIREHPIEGRRFSGAPSSGVSIMRRMVGAGSGFGRTIRVWDVPPSHEDDRLSWSDRWAVRCGCDNTELEHDHRYPPDFERPAGKELMTRVL